MGSKPNLRAKSEIYRVGGKIPEPTQKQRCHQPYFRANSEIRRVTYLISEPTQKSNGFKAAFQSQVRNLQGWRIGGKIPEPKLRNKVGVINHISEPTQTQKP